MNATQILNHNNNTWAPTDPPATSQRPPPPLRAVGASWRRSAARRQHQSPRRPPQPAAQQAADGLSAPPRHRLHHSQTKTLRPEAESAAAPSWAWAWFRTTAKKLSACSSSVPPPGCVSRYTVSWCRYTPTSTASPIARSSTTDLSARTLLALLEECNPDDSNNRAA